MSGQPIFKITQEPNCVKRGVQDQQNIVQSSMWQVAAFTLWFMPTNPIEVELYPLLVLI